MNEETKEYEYKKQNDYTTVRVTRETRDRLKNFGSKKETYNEIVERLLNMHGG